MKRRHIPSWAVVAAVVALASFVVGWGGRRMILVRRLAQFETNTSQLARTIGDNITRSEVHGVARMLGLSNRRIRAVLNGEIPVDDPGLLKDLVRIQQHYHAAIIYVLNTEGTVVACTPYDDNQTLTGQNYQFRPYFAQALAGHDEVYPSLGVTTGRRGLYASAPVHELDEEGGLGPILGVVTVKMGLDAVDALMASMGSPTALVSSSGVIFSSDRADWVFRTIEPISEDMAASLNATRQFGSRAPLGSALFEKGLDPLHVPFDGETYAMARAALPLTDEYGAWSLVRLEPLRSWCPLWYMGGLVGVLALIGLLTWLMLYYRRHHHESEQIRASLEAHLIEQQRLEAVGTLAGGVAHEINNPITGVMNYAQLIRDGLGEENRYARFAGEIVQESERIAAIVRNLMLFAREDVGAREPTALAELVSETVSLVRVMLRHDFIDVQLDVPEDLPRVTGNRQALQQTLMNLLQNARQALNTRYHERHPDKRIRLTGARFEDEQGAWVRLTVEDFGVGMDAETLEHAQEPFFTTHPRSRHAGLGLSMAHGMVRELGGRLTIESQPHRFTRVYVDLKPA